MNTHLHDTLARFRWQPQPAAAEFVEKMLGEHLGASRFLTDFASRLLTEAGVRLSDLVDYFQLPTAAGLDDQLAALGFTATHGEPATVWRHAQGLFPNIRTSTSTTRRLALRVESVTDFLTAHDLDDRVAIKGPAGGPLRSACVNARADMELLVVERHGCTQLTAPQPSDRKLALAPWHLERFRLRRRAFDNPRAGFAHASNLIRSAVADLGADWACDLFFSAERAYWQHRNRAGQAQWQRQHQLGIGWANHDHHTFRSSREHFADLVATLELLGFECRERFYGGREAGWGAQVLEQPDARIVIFADVDLSPAEVAGDFAHQGLPPREELGTVGLWCQLHGEAFLEAGMHHLECQFDFDAARSQLAGLGIESMRPFTDLPYLKQAFTVGQYWPVAPERLKSLLADGRISQRQADVFAQQGALGSHLEILERNSGYKGFNQTGISEIIAETDPRGARVNLVSPNRG